MTQAGRQASPPERGVGLADALGLPIGTGGRQRRRFSVISALGIVAIRLLRSILFLSLILPTMLHFTHSTLIIDNDSMSYHYIAARPTMQLRMMRLSIDDDLFRLPAAPPSGTAAASFITACSLFQPTSLPI